ncbi:MAG: cytochrome c biogenesis protein CcdA [Anaerolineae bacterium]|jgi:cytochrome c-type biogenesis protein|nr:cytochrome c biogenesis protein CcdA [Anaerolineae bacterium]
MDVSLGIAFLAGLISFLSPCVLPLVPAYVSYMGGRLGQTVETQVVAVGGGAAAAHGLSARFALLLHGLAFVSGFTLVFVLLGVTTTALVQQLGGQNIRGVTDIIARLGGVLIVFFGLHFSGLLASTFGRVRALGERGAAVLVAGLTVLGAVVMVWGFAGRLTVWERVQYAPTWPDALGVLAAALWLFGLFWFGAFTQPRGFLHALVGRLDAMLYADTRRQLDNDPSSGLGGSLVMGVVFSAGWSPCIGAVYGSILTMSANTGNVASAAVLLTAYSLGLGFPFLLAAFALDGVQGVFKRINRRMRMVKLVSGLLLVMVGLLVMSGELARINAYLQTGSYGEWSLQLEECGIAAAQGTLEGSLQDCLSQP